MTKDQKIIRAEVGQLDMAKQLGNVSQACKMMGYGRNSFFRFKGLLRRRSPNQELHGLRVLEGSQADHAEPKTIYLAESAAAAQLDAFRACHVEASRCGEQLSQIRNLGRFCLQSGCRIWRSIPISRWIAEQGERADSLPGHGHRRAEHLRVQHGRTGGQSIEVGFARNCRLPNGSPR